MEEIMKFHHQQLAQAIMKKSILIAGTEALILQNVDPVHHIDFLKLSNILNAYKDAYDRIKAEIEWNEHAIGLDKKNEKNIIEEGGEKNDSESI